MWAVGGLRWTGRAVLAGAAITLAFAASARAAAPAVNVGSPLSSGPPAVAVDSAGDAIVAWANTQDLGGASNYVQYCVLPLHATACSHSGNLIPADSASNIDGTQVLVDGSTIVVLADVYGAAGNSAADYEPDQEWQSTDGGATFTLVNSGVSVTSGILNADTGPLTAVILPGTGVLGYGWDTAAGPPTFNAFPLASPPECSVKTCPAGFATLQPSNSPEMIGNPGGQFAAQAGSAPGVLGVFPTLFSNGPFACASSTPDGVAFVYGTGNQSASNSYNVSPGSPGSAWRAPVALGECGMRNVAVGGGPSGFGVVATDEPGDHTVYQRFDQTKQSFATFPNVTLSAQSELSPSVSQDAKGAVYATYFNGGIGSPVALSYSPDGGKSWAGPASLDGFASQTDLTSTVNAASQGWAAWRQNGSIFAQPFTAADVPTAPTVGPRGASTRKKIKLTVTCGIVPCTLKLTVHPRHGHRRLAKGTVVISTMGTHNVILKLPRVGRHYIALHRGTVKLKVVLSQAAGGLTLPGTGTVKIHHEGT